MNKVHAGLLRYGVAVRTQQPNPSLDPTAASPRSSAAGQRKR
ncbi:MAG: hypothetical protein WBX11_07930 [Thiobacillaceae bacterium]